MARAAAQRDERSELQARIVDRRHQQSSRPRPIRCIAYRALQNGFDALSTTAADLSKRTFFSRRGNEKTG